MMNRNSRLQRGSTMPEVLIASTLSALVLLASVSAFLMAMSGWIRGQGRIDAESNSQRAIRRIATEIREAMMVSVDGNGLGVTFRRPLLDEEGSFETPVTWDGVSRRIELSGTELVLINGSDETVISRGVTTRDPIGGNAYRIFTPGGGAVTRSVTVMLATQHRGEGASMEKSRGRETIFLRNIPELMR